MLQHEEISVRGSVFNVGITQAFFIINTWPKRRGTLETAGSDGNAETLINVQIPGTEPRAVKKNLCSQGVFWALPPAGTKS